MYPSKNITRNTLILVNVMIAVGAVILKVVNPIVVSYTDEIRRADIVNFTVFTPCIMLALSLILYRTMEPLRSVSGTGALTAAQRKRLRTVALNIPYRVFTQFNAVILTAVGLVALPIDHFLFPFYPLYKRFISMGLIWSYTICTSFLVYAYLKRLMLPLLQACPSDEEDERAVRIPIKTSFSLTAFGFSAMILLFLSSYGYFLTREAYGYGAAKSAEHLLLSVRDKIAGLNDISAMKEYVSSEYPHGEVFLVDTGGDLLTALPADITEGLKVEDLLSDFHGADTLFSEQGNLMFKILPLDASYAGPLLGTVFSFDLFVRKKLGNMRTFLIMISGFFLIFAWAINYYVGRSVSDTIVSIEQRTRHLTDSQEIDYREIEVVSNDEIGDLTRAFNRLQGMVHYYHNKLTAEYSKYLSPNIAAQIKANPGMMQNSERREMTVMFSDLKDFTRFSEGNSPERVVSVLNEHFDTMAAIIDRWDGTLDKYMGDGLLAFWGAPAIQEDHAELGLQCALEMMGALAELRSKWAAGGVGPLDMGIGLNTGQMVVGNMGAKEKKMDYTVIGDQVNLASRIEQLTRTFNTGIVISESTYKAVSGSFGTDGLSSSLGISPVQAVRRGPVMVKGKSTPVTVYEIIPVSDT